MSELGKNERIEITEESKDLTDKLHRLMRRFSRELVDLVYQELGARKVVVKGKPGPKPGYKHKRQPCPLCKMNQNSHRRYGFICKDCRAGKEIGHRTKMKEVFGKKWKRSKKRGDHLGPAYKVTVPIPKNIPVQPKEVEVEDSEPDFLDRLIEVVPIEQPKAAETPKKNDSSDDMDFFS